MGRATHSFNRMMSASTLNIWYSPEASFTRRMMELVSCVMGYSVDGQEIPWYRCSSSRWTARTEMARGRMGQDFILAHQREAQAWGTAAVKVKSISLCRVYTDVEYIQSICREYTEDIQSIHRVYIGYM